MWPIVARAWPGVSFESDLYGYFKRMDRRWGSVEGRGGVLAATREGGGRLPFALLGFDSDNGGEFLNHHLHE